MLDYNSLGHILTLANDRDIPVSQLVLEDQANTLDVSLDEVYKAMSKRLDVMEASIEGRLKGPFKSPSGLSGGDAYKLNESFKKGNTIGGRLLDKMLIRALACAEGNACMDKIVAAPTAGACGIIPAVLLTIMEEHKIPREKIIMGLFTSGAIGMAIAKRASISGAEGGCQAECGSASAMAAGALVEILGGTTDMIGHAAGIALKGVLGLVCDPVAGLVEVPCIKRNALGAANALSSANLALAGIESMIPVDEIIDAMRQVGDLMTPALKETSEAGLATTETAISFTQKLNEKEGS
ncbi:MAG: L-serine ammonia-lyase, iron-sulfur-dependent, subunit alpha [Clostridiales bacterium]|nr:L-serine ammonia-lyase, iron-sulfur-dependent, subunit alpha [Clostridiales bacterium]